MKPTRISRMLCIVLSLLLMLSGVSFAAPVLRPVETADEMTLTVDESMTSLAAKGIKPGLNMLSQTANPWSFEGDMTDITGIVSGYKSVAVVANPLKDSVNSSESVLNLVAASTYPSVTFTLPQKFEPDRPVYVSYKYYKAYEAADAETPKIDGVLWTMKNGSSFIADEKNDFLADGKWRSSGKLIDFTTAYQAGNPSNKNKDAIATISLQAKMLENAGKTLFYFDDLFYVPSYKLSYFANDGTDTVVQSAYFLFDENGEILTTYAPDLSVKAPDRYGYIFKGWSLNASATAADAPASIELQNEDINLYAVWEKDETVPEPTIYKWDFEDNTKQGWQTNNTGYSLSVNNGIALVDTNAYDKVGTPYLSHTKVSLDTKAHRYFVIKARSLDSVAELKIYFNTTTYPQASEQATVKIPIQPNAKTFNEYYIDMSTNPYWTGNYTGGMYQFNGGGKIEIEEMYFSTLYEKPEAPVIKEYHYPQSAFSAWGTHSVVKNSDGTITFDRTELNSSGNSQGAMNIAAPSETLDTAVYNKLVIKAKSDADLSFKVYFSTSSSGGYNETNTQTSKNADFTDGDYKYYIVDFSDKANFKDSMNTMMLQCNTVTTAATIADVYFTNQVSDSSNVSVEKALLNASADEITEDGGLVTLKPYIRYSDGKESTAAAAYVTDSVNGVLKTNADGSATLTGKVNGEITVTAYVEGSNFTVSKTIRISGQPERLAVNSFKLLTYGNSIMNHGPSASIGWNGSWGMAASSKDKDYVHRLISYLDQKYGEGTVKHEYGAALATFERAVVKDDPNKDYSNYVNDLVSYAQRANPDIITIQIGENVNTGPTVASYENAIRQFITGLQKEVPNAMIVVCTPFWDGANLVTGMNNIAAEFDLPIAQLHTLNTRENMAYDFFEHEGVGHHPGDLGMDRIAKLIFEQINLRLSTDERTVYTTVPKELHITAPSTAITEEKGTLQLSAQILPADAAQDVIWTTTDKNIASVTQDGLVTAVNNGGVIITATSRFDEALSKSEFITISGQTAPHTVTYDKNTEDEVSGMPKPNTLAKENFPLNDVFPVRETYKFLGWALTPDGEPVASVDVTEDITVYAQWAVADSWSFDTDGYKENFTIQNGFNQYVLNGVFMSIATGTDAASGNVLKVVSPKLNLNAADYHALVLVIQNTEINASTTLKLTVKTTNGNVDFSQAVTSREYTTYEFPLANVTGTITGFEFTPTNVDGTINLDEIAFMQEPLFSYNANTSASVSGMPTSIYFDSQFPATLSDKVPTRTGYTFLGWSKKADSKLLLSDDVVITEPGMVYAVWDKNDHWEFDTSKGINVSNVDEDKTVFDGVLHYESNTTDPIVTPNCSFGYPVSSTSGKIEMRMKWSSTVGMTSQIFFRTSAADTLSEANSSKTGLESYGLTTDDYKSIIVDFTSKSGWSGTLNYLRFDCTSDKGTTDIDYIRFTNSEANILTNKGEVRKVATDWASYLVKEGGTLAPQGAAELGALHLSGDIDFTDGYILVNGDVEIAEEAPYAVFTPDMDALGLTSESYMRMVGYDDVIEPKNGAKYIVKLTDGVGFVYFGTMNDVAKRATYRVTKDGVEKADDFVVTDDQVSIRIKEPTGIRYRATVAHNVIGATVEKDGFRVKEYGYLVSTSMKMSDPARSLTLAAVEAGKAKIGIAYENYGNDKNIIYDVDDQNVVFTAALVNIPDTKEAYTAQIYVRTYMILDSGVVIYGNPVSESVYNVAKNILAAEGQDESLLSYVQHIVDVAEAE